MNRVELGALTVIFVACLVGCDEAESVQDAESPPTDTDLGVAQPIGESRLFPIADFDDPLETLHEIRTLSDCQIWVERFQPRDRIASERITITYDFQSRWVLEEVDIGRDRIVERRRSRTFDSDGALMRLETDSNGDGLPDQTIVYNWETGRLISEDYDQESDGTFDGRRRLRYNARGWLVAEEWLGLPLGEVQQRTLYEYDDEGRPVSVMHTNGIDDILAWRIISMYDEYGRLTDWQEDRDGDGEADYRVLYTINDDLRRVVERHDQGNDGRIDGITSTEYDDLNRPILRELDQGGDGTINERIRFDYEGNQLLRRSIDRDLDGREEELTQYTYDEMGRLVEKTSDSVIGDEIPAESWTVSYFCR